MRRAPEAANPLLAQPLTASIQAQSPLGIVRLVVDSVLESPRAGLETATKIIAMSRLTSHASTPAVQYWTSFRAPLAGYLPMSAASNGEAKITTGVGALLSS